MSTYGHTRNLAAFAATLVLAALIALLALPRLAGAAQDHFDLPGDDWSANAEDESLRIVINVPARRLALVQGETLVRAYPVAVGRPWTQTPRGDFHILQKAKDPTWAPKGRPAVPPGPNNPLGHRWMRISEDGYGIHATNEPNSIGKARSHGCIRMSREDAEDLFERVRVGTKVQIVYELDGFDEDGNPTRFADLYGLVGEQGGS
jgi:lipoprotein-anchoring transpeptidase ErfK/SrfK